MEALCHCFENHPLMKVIFQNAESVKVLLILSVMMINMIIRQGKALLHVTCKLD